MNGPSRRGSIGCCRPRNGFRVPWSRVIENSGSPFFLARSLLREHRTRKRGGISNHFRSNAFAADTGILKSAK
jgi:hypothetical protein